MFDVKNLFKYVLEGLAVGIVAKMTLGDRITQEEILMLGLVAAATFAVLDALAPMIGLGARLGTGIAIGGKLLPEGYTDASQYGGYGHEEGEEEENEGYRDLQEYEDVPVM